MYAWEPRHAKTCQDNWEVRWSSLSQSCGTGGKSGAFAGGFRPAMVIPRKEKTGGWLKHQSANDYLVVGVGWGWWFLRNFETSEGDDDNLVDPIIRQKKSPKSPISMGRINNP